MNQHLPSHSWSYLYSITQQSGNEVPIQESMKITYGIAMVLPWRFNEIPTTRECLNCFQLNVAKCHLIKYIKKFEVLLSKSLSVE